jgi:hypothetical protein
LRQLPGGNAPVKTITVDRAGRPERARRNVEILKEYSQTGDFLFKLALIGVSSRPAVD